MLQEEDERAELATPTAESPTVSVRPRAFLVSPTTHDISSASAYGTLTHVFQRNAAVPALFSAEYQEVMLNEMIRTHDYNAEVDYIVVSGSMQPLAIAIAELASFFGVIKLLCFDARCGKYVVVSVGEDENSGTR